MAETSRTAIAGIGGIAEVYARSIADIDTAKLVAGACRTESTGREFTSAHDCSWYADTDRMLDDADPDVLIVCTPSGAHLEPTLAAAERGIDVLCEKPLEITTERIDRMIDAAESADIALGGIFQQRFRDVFQRVHDAAAEGRFGSLSVANAYVPWWRDDEYYADAWQGTEELGGGALLNQSIHGIDAMQWLASATMDLDGDENPVEEVVAYTARRGHDDEHVEVEDTAVAALRYRNGALGHVLGATSMYPGSHQRVQLSGRDGTTEVRGDELVTWEFRDDRDTDAQIRDTFNERNNVSDGADDSEDMDYADYRRNLSAFIDSLESDASYVLDVTEARKAVAIIEAIYESADTGEPVRVS